MKNFSLIIGLVLLIVNFIYADILTLKNGEKIEGVIMEEEDVSIKFKEYLGGAGFAISTYQKSEIINIERWTEEENKGLIERYEMMQKEWERKQREIPPQREPQPPVTPTEIKREPVVEPSAVTPGEELIQKREELLEEQTKEREERKKKREELEKEREERFREKEEAKEGGQELYNKWVYPGMSEKDVKRLWGPPSYKEMPATDEEIWVYDTQYEGKYTVHFKRGKVIEVEKE